MTISLDHFGTDIDQISQHEKLCKIHLAVLDACLYTSTSYIITRINVPKAHRGQGIGSLLLRRAINAADNRNIKLFLEIAPSDGLNYQKLEAWYMRYGFAWANGVCGMMGRKPATKYEASK